MNLFDFWSSFRGRWPEEGIEAVRKFVPAGDKDGYVFPIEGEGRLYVGGHTYYQKVNRDSSEGVLSLGCPQHSFSLRRLFYCDYFPDRLCVEIYDHRDGMLNILPFDDLAREDKYEFINELLMFDDHVIKRIEHYNDSLPNKELHNVRGDKYSVDSFVLTIKREAGLFADIKVYQTLTTSSAARTVIEIPGKLRGMEGVNKIVVESDKEKEHIRWVYLYGNLREDEDNTIPRRLFKEYSVFLQFINKDAGEQILQYRVIENHLNSIEIDALRHYITHLKKEYKGLFRLDIEEVFNDVFSANTIVVKHPYFSSALAYLPAQFKEDFSKRLLDDIPLSNSELDLNKLTRLFGEIVQNRLTTLPYYRHYCVILNLLNSELRNHIKHDAVDHLSGKSVFYTDEEPDYSTSGEIVIHSSERYGKVGVTNLTGRIGITSLTINEGKLRSRIGEKCSSSLDDFANPDFNLSFLGKEPLKEFLWWGEVGSALYIPFFPNKLSKGGFRHMGVDYDIREKVPSNSFMSHIPFPQVSEKGLDRFMDQLCRQLSIPERDTTIVTENKEQDGEISTVIELPSFNHYYKTVTLTYRDRERIEGIMLSGVKLYEIANSFSGSFLGFPVTLVMQRTDSLFQNLFFRVL